MSGMNALAGTVTPLMSWSCEHLGEAGPEAARVDHVAGQEHLHLARHALGALAPRLVAEGVRAARRRSAPGRRGGTRASRAGSAGRSETSSGHVEVAGAVDDRGGLDAEAVHLVLGVHRLVGAARALEEGEQLLALPVRLAHEHLRRCRRSPRWRAPCARPGSRARRARAGSARTSPAPAAIVRRTIMVCRSAAPPVVRRRERPTGSSGSSRKDTVNLCGSPRGRVPPDAAGV